MHTKIHIVEAYFLERSYDSILQFLQRIFFFDYFRKPKGETKKAESFKLQPARQPPTVMPNIKPRPNLHAQHHNLDTLERLVFEDFNATPYTSKSTIGPNQSFTSSMADLHHDLNKVSSFSRCLNGINSH